MKKVILTLALIITAQFGFSQKKAVKATKVEPKKETAAPQSEEAYKADLLSIVKKSPMGAQIGAVKNQVMKQIPAEKQAAFAVEFDSKIAELYQKLVPVYAETYSKEDVKSMLAFYNSPVGKKMEEKSSSLTEKSQAVAQEWGQDFQAFMMKYMQPDGGQDAPAAEPAVQEAPKN